jgi:hypothetical protein
MKRNGKVWNNGNLELSLEKMRRARGNCRAMVGAPCESVLARVRQLLAPRHGETHWFVTQDSAHHMGAVLLKPELAIGKLEIDLAACHEGTLLCLDFVYTAISASGNALFDDQIDGRILQMLRAVVQELQGGVVAPDELLLPGPGPTSRSRDAFRPESAGASHESVVRASADECFALACPVAELAWIDNWQFHLLYSDSGRNEDDCIFIEAVSGIAVHRAARSDTYWYTTLYDSAARRFHAVLLTGAFIIGKWSFAVDAIGDGTSRMRWVLMHTGLNEEGNRIILERGFEARVANMLHFLSRSATHFMESGDILRLPARRKARLALLLLSAVVGRHVGRWLPSTPK